jgi:hypothetical protein
MLAFPLEEDTPQSRFSFKLAFDIFPKLMSDYIKALRVILEDVPSRLRQITFDRAEVRPAPGKWSPKEVIGHLIDSASNNHQRFVRAQFQDNLIFLGYAQDDWVRVQDYQSADWAELIQLWEQYNFHLARVMERVPARSVSASIGSTIFIKSRGKRFPRTSPRRSIISCAIMLDIWRIISGNSCQHGNRL